VIEFGTDAKISSAAVLLCGGEIRMQTDIKQNRNSYPAKLTKPTKK